MTKQEREAERCEQLRRENVRLWTLCEMVLLVGRGEVPVESAVELAAEIAREFLDVNT